MQYYKWKTLKNIVVHSKENIKYYIPAEELSDVIDAADKEVVGHGMADVTDCCMRNMLMSQNR